MADQPPATAATTSATDSTDGLSALLTRSAYLFAALHAVLGDRLVVDTRRDVQAQGSCGMALEYGANIGVLLELDNVASAIVLLRAQVEALVRALWFDGGTTGN